MGRDGPFLATSQHLSKGTAPTVRKTQCLQSGGKEESQAITITAHAWESFGEGGRNGRRREGRQYGASKEGIGPGLRPPVT